MPTWDDVLALQGFSSAANRLILNRAVAAIPRARILEVGSYMGSTAVAMCHGNDVQSIHMVDNHSEFGRTDAALAGTCLRFLLPSTIHDLDFFRDITADTFGGEKFNVYLYDGPHDEEQHAAELAVAWPHLDRSFLYIVDDYSWDKVRRGCDAGIEAHAGKMRIDSQNIYPSARLNDSDGYWNGLLVAWCTKIE